MNAGNCFLFYIIAYLVYLSNKNFHNDVLFLLLKQYLLYQESEEIKK